MRRRYIPLLDDPEPLHLGNMTRGMRVCHPPTGETGTVQGFDPDNGNPVIRFDGDRENVPFRAGDLVALEDYYGSPEPAEIVEWAIGADDAPELPYDPRQHGCY